MSKSISKEQVFQNMENMHINTCVVCYKNVDIYSIGMCEHPVCYECSTRMRVLCRQNECPICRQDLPKVVFTREVKPFRFLHKGSLFDVRYHIYFDSEDIQQKFNALLADTCTICKERQMFNNFNSLKDHMRREHELHYCDLCVENLKIFSHERRCYTRTELAQHRRKGDIDDKSHKGHPLCEFCDQRYMDNDELYRHLRRDHLYCHFCDADGLHQYYNSYDYLRDHFRQEHFLCEEGPCIEEKFTSVFRTNIDLKAHKTSVHGKQLSKAAAKQARTLELEFTLAPRGDNRNNRRGIPGPSTSKNMKDLNNSKEYNSREYQQSTEAASTSNYFSHETDPVFVRQPTVDVQSTAEFPTLGNTAPFVPNTNQTKGRGNVTIRSTVRPQPLAVTDENFPALGPESSNAISKTVNFSLTSSNKPGGNLAQAQQSTPNVSIEVNHESNGMVTTRVSGPNIRIRPWMESDFPALGAANPSVSTSSNSANPVHWKESLQWTFSKSTPPTANKSKKPVPPLAAPSLPAIRSGEDFPTLPKGKPDTNAESKSKKQSVITVVPTWGQPSTSTNGSKNAPDATKGRSKKKKVKQACNNNNPNSNETNSSKLNTNACETKEINDTVTRNSAGTSSSTASEMERKVEDSLLKKGTTNNVKSENTKKTEHMNKKEKKKSKSGTVDNTRTVHEESASSSSNNAQRKRTELKIHNLNTANNNTCQTEEPVNVVRENSTPPGFTTPPPGFSMVSQSSPGLYVKYGNMECLEGGNGLTFTNSSGESYSILPDNCNETSSHTYIPPPDFQKRNKNLVAKINEVLKRQEQIEDFRYFSGFFRRGTCNAVDYYKYCQEIIGSTSFESIFSELLVLLPDIIKQQELFNIYKKEFNNKSRNLEACPTCGQIVKCGNDFTLHISGHTLENHFPLLGRNSMLPTKNTWVRK